MKSKNMKKILVLTPSPDKNYFKNKLNLPHDVTFIVNVSALLYASFLKQKGEPVKFHDYWQKKEFDFEQFKRVDIFSGYANYENSLKIREILLKKGVNVTLNGVSNFVDGQNFSDISVLEERGYKCNKPLVDMNTELDYTLVDLPELFKIQNKLKQKRNLVVLSQYYGCPKKNNCLHCSTAKLKCEEIVLTKNPKQLIGEIIKLNKEYNIEKIILSDLMNTSARIKQLSKLYINNYQKEAFPKLTLSTACNFINKETIDSLIELNCEEIFLGVETYNDDLLKVLDKPFTINDIDRALNLLFKANIKARISIMLGVLGESEKSLENTRKFIKKWIEKKIVTGDSFLKLQVSILTPIPNSELYNILKKKIGKTEIQKIINSLDWIERLQQKYFDIFIENGPEKDILLTYKEIVKYSISSYI